MEEREEKSVEKNGKMENGDGINVQRNVSNIL